MHQIVTRDPKKSLDDRPFPATARNPTHPKPNPFPGQAGKNVQERFQDGPQEKAKNIIKTAYVHAIHGGIV